MFDLRDRHQHSMSIPSKTKAQNRPVQVCDLVHIFQPLEHFTLSLQHGEHLPRDPLVPGDAGLPSLFRSLQDPGDPLAGALPLVERARGEDGLCGLAHGEDLDGGGGEEDGAAEEGLGGAVCGVVQEGEDAVDGVLRLGLLAVLHQAVGEQGERGVEGGGEGGGEPGVGGARRGGEGGGEGGGQLADGGEAGRGGQRGEAADRSEGGAHGHRGGGGDTAGGGGGGVDTGVECGMETPARKEHITHLRNTKSCTSKYFVHRPQPPQPPQDGKTNSRRSRPSRVQGGRHRPGDGAGARRRRRDGRV